MRGRRARISFRRSLLAGSGLAPAPGTEPDAAYWAGVFDTNGSISIERRKSVRNRAFFYVVSVRVVLRASPRAGQLMDELWPRSVEASRGVEGSC